MTRRGFDGDDEQDTAQRRRVDAFSPSFMHTAKAHTPGWRAGKNGWGEGETKEDVRFDDDDDDGCWRRVCIAKLQAFGRSCGLSFLSSSSCRLLVMSAPLSLSLSRVVMVVVVAMVVLEVLVAGRSWWSGQVGSGRGVKVKGQL
jgi:hypothetical protein